MIDLSVMRTITGPELAGILTGNSSRFNVLDHHRYGRWLPEKQRNPGQGNYRKISERDAAAVVAATMLTGATVGKSKGQPLADGLMEAADNLAWVLRSSAVWPEYAIWCFRDQRLTFADDAETAVELSTHRGGGRIVPLAQAVAAVR